MSQRTWFITGTSRGFGREWTEAALGRGDRVVATARDPRALDDLVREHPDSLLPLQLDVTDRPGVFDAVARAREHFGELDIVVNNAGYAQFGVVEEVTEHEARDQMETNFFGPLWVTQAALPFLRERQAGHIIQVSSVGGLTAFPGIGMYHASKWALEGFSQSLMQEVAEFGIHVTLIEPGAFSTGFIGAIAVPAQQRAGYERLHEDLAQRRAETLDRADPGASAQALMRVVDAERPPLRAFFGRTPLSIVEQDYADRLATWRAWQPVAELAHGNGAPV